MFKNFQPPTPSAVFPLCSGQIGPGMHSKSICHNGFCFGGVFYPGIIDTLAAPFLGTLDTNTKKGLGFWFLEGPE